MELKKSDNQLNQDGLTFETLQRESTLSNRVTGQIETFILKGRLKPGDRLLSERAMSEQFGVSRTVIREAVRALVAKGLLEVQSGRGTVVKSPPVEAVTQSIAHFLYVRSSQFDYKKVLEIRYALEVAIVELAARRIKPEDVQEIEQILHEKDQALTDLNKIVANDVSFHTALARATHNELFPLMLDSVIDFIGAMNEMARDVLETPIDPDTYLAEHRAIFVKVKAGDPAGARQAMHEHLLHAEAMMNQIMATLADNESENKLD